MLDRADGDGEPSAKRLALHGPAQALQYRLVRFMKDVSVADLVLPGRRIDVPLERVGVSKNVNNNANKSVTTNLPARQPGELSVAITG